MTFDKIRFFSEDDCKRRDDELKELYKETKWDILETYQNLLEKTIISQQFFDIIVLYYREIQNKIDESRDLLFDYFALKLLQRIYLLGTKDSKNLFHPIERPQHMFMRIALTIHFSGQSKHNYDNLRAVFETYDLLSLHKATHASPTYFNSGTKVQQMASCFLLGTDDSIPALYETLKSVATIASKSGGIGLHLSNVRPEGTDIRGGQSQAGGIIPYCKVLQSACGHIQQGGKRTASMACYLELWHADIFDFCSIKQNLGDENKKVRDLFGALWVSDLFMERVYKNEPWVLTNEILSPGLSDCYGEKFRKLYEKYEKEGKYMRKIMARDLWNHIIVCIIETGGPYVLFKDHANHRSNQNNLGTIKSSNLCAEIIQYSDANEHSCCNLASLALTEYCDGTTYDFKELGAATRILVRNINKIIDFMDYPTPESKTSNLKHRPLGIGVQGLSDVYNKMHLPFDSEEANTLNVRIFETIYFYALDESCTLARTQGYYESFPGSQFQNGILQFHHDKTGLKLSRDLDWDNLIKNIQKYGTRNSLLTAIMPTASTSYLFNNSESIEIPICNIYRRKTGAGEHILINKYLVYDLRQEGLWNPDLRTDIILAKGSVQNLDIPQRIKNIYKTPFEVGMDPMVFQSAQRGAFIDQSQSFNTFLKEPDCYILHRSLFLAWHWGMKTASYYCRSLPAVDPIEFGTDLTKQVEVIQKNTFHKNQKADLQTVNPMMIINHKYVPPKCNINDSNCLSCSS